jgi:hypothetical protein
MNDPGIAALGGGIAIVYIVFVLLALFAAILWILLPFAVFGIKPKLDMLLAEARQTNAYLKALTEQQRPAPPRPLPPVPKA